MTTEPPAGAAPDNVTTPVVDCPPEIVGGFRPIETSESAPPPVTVSVALAVPLNDAVIVAEPAPTVVIVNVADDPPAAIDTLAGTVATAVLLLDSVTVAPPDAAVLNPTLAETGVPAATLDWPSVTLVTAAVGGGGFVVGGVGPLPPHWTIDSIVMAAAMTKPNDLAWRIVVSMGSCSFGLSNDD